MQKEKRFVIALGGSIICPGKINTAYLRRFYLFVKKEIKRGNKFVIVAGGGIIARQHQKAALKVVKVTDEDKDWMGVHATRLNAHLLRTIFRKEADPIVFDDRFKLKDFNHHSVIIASGWHPGWSTDFVAVQIAVDFGIKRVIILGKPSFVYTADHQKYKKAKPIKEIVWKDYLKIIPKNWQPGLSSPVDPVAARLAKKEKQEVIVANAKNLKNLKKILKKEEFRGTILN